MPENATITVEPMLPVTDSNSAEEFLEDVEPDPGLLDTLVLFQVEEEV